MVCPWFCGVGELDSSCHGGGLAGLELDRAEHAQAAVAPSAVVEDVQVAAQPAQSAVRDRPSGSRWCARSRRCGRPRSRWSAQPGPEPGHAGGRCSLLRSRWWAPEAPWSEPEGPPPAPPTVGPATSSHAQQGLDREQRAGDLAHRPGEPHDVDLAAARCLRCARLAIAAGHQPHSGLSGGAKTSAEALRSSWPPNAEPAWPCR
jgi:hypothetical protein